MNPVSLIAQFMANMSKKWHFLTASLVLNLQVAEHLLADIKTLYVI
jgi:hypothetical protein